MTYLIKMIAPNYPDTMKIPFEYKKENFLCNEISIKKKENTAKKVTR